MREKFVVKKEILDWALAEAGVDKSAVLASKKYAKVLFETGQASFTNLTNLANSLHIPLAYLFLDSVPKKKVSSPEMRTIENIKGESLSQNLRETIGDMRVKQNWMSDYRQSIGLSPIPYLGSMASFRESADRGSFARQASDLAGRILGVKGLWSLGCRDDAAAYKSLRRRLESAGVLVMANGVVGSNSSRLLDLEEFRGFALLDRYAPLIFVNTHDRDSAKSFTLIHEFIHLLVGSKADLISYSDEDVLGLERAINEATASFLMPEAILRSLASSKSNDAVFVKTMASYFKVSQKTMALRLLKLRLVSDEVAASFANVEYENSVFAKPKATGGDYYRSLNLKISAAFAKAVVSSINENSITYTDGFRLLGISGRVYNQYVLGLEKATH